MTLAELGNETCRLLLISQRILIDLNASKPSQREDLDNIS
jgi:hypothetical protein